MPAIRCMQRTLTVMAAAPLQATMVSPPHRRTGLLSCSHMLCCRHPDWPTSRCVPTFAVLLCSANLSAKDTRTSVCCACVCPGSQESGLLLWLSSLSK